jgi:hypothetical protein
MAYESGDLTQEEIVAGFQELIDSGLVWGLQGTYGRQAEQLIKAGLCHPVGRKRIALDQPETTIWNSGCENQPLLTNTARERIEQLEKQCKCAETNGGGDCDACQEIEHIRAEIGEDQP